MWGVSVLLMAMVMRQKDRGPLWTSLLMSTSNGRWPPSCSATWTPFTHCRHRKIWGGGQSMRKSHCHLRYPRTQRCPASFYLPHQPDGRNGVPVEIRQSSQCGHERFPPPTPEDRLSGDSWESGTPRETHACSAPAPARSPCLLLAVLTTMA